MSFKVFYIQPKRETINNIFYSKYGKCDKIELEEVDNKAILGMVIRSICFTYFKRYDVDNGFTLVEYK